MYCDKLRSILNNPSSFDLGINLEVVRKLDFFLKSNVTMMGRQKINPITFAIEMSLSEQVALSTFIIGTREKLFSARAYYNCICDEFTEIYSKSVKRRCLVCGREIIPWENKDRVFLYFKLNEELTNCGDIFTVIKDFHLDYLDDELLGKSNASLIDAETILGEAEAENLIFNQRSATLENYLLGKKDIDYGAT